MRRFTRIKEAKSRPQAGGVYFQREYYRPAFWHTAIEQDRAVGSKSTFREHVHDLYHMVLYTRGTGEFFQNGSFFPAEPGTLVLTSPGQRHDFVSRRGSTVYSEITFSYETETGEHLTLGWSELLSEFSQCPVRLADFLRLSPETTLAMQSGFERLTDLLNAGDAHAMYRAHRVFWGILDLLMDAPRAGVSPAEPADGAGLAMQWIEKHYAEPIRVEEAADAAGVSKGYLFRLFKESYGISPLAYQQKLRMEAAKTLLKTTTLSCREIAMRVGYADSCLFHRMFKKQTGKSPKRYRKE